MKNRKIMIDRPELPDSQISGYRDFNSMKNMPVNSGFQSSLFKSAWFYAGVAGIAIITGVVIFLTDFPGDLANADSNPDSLKQVSVVQPPFPELAAPYEEYAVNTTSDTTILTNSGSLLHIPARAFTELDGSPVEPEIVYVKYREFHSPYDFFANGIPMQYDSAGTSYTFQSAGMLEILAFDDGNALDLAEGKEIAIDMVSYDSRDIYNLYSLDTLTGQWEYHGRDEMTEIAEIPSLHKPVNVENECHEVFVDDIWKPVLRNEKKFAFTLEVDKKEFPELSSFDDIVFEVDESKCIFDPLFYSVQWNNIDLSKSDAKGLYTLLLSKTDTSVSLTVYPVVDRKKYNEAMKVYNQAIEEAEAQKKETVDDRVIRPANQDEYFEFFNNDMLYSTFTPASFRRINIATLGIWNCDKAVYPKGRNFTPEFVNMNDEDINYKGIYLVELDENVLYQLPAYEDISVNTRKKNLLWLLTDEHHIAIHSGDINEALKDQKKIMMEEYDYITGMEVVREKAGQPEGNNMEIDINTFPNPVDDWLNIELSESIQAIVQILDEKGSIISVMSFEESKIKINMKTYPPGNYIINVVSQRFDFRKSVKIVKI